MKKLSLKLRIILALLSVSFVVWIVVGIVSWFSIKEEIDEFFDTYQALLARQLATANWDSVTLQTQKQTNKIIKNLDNKGEIDDSLGFAIFDKNGNMIFNDGKKGKYFINSNKSGFDNQKVDGDKWRILWLRTSDNHFVVAVGQELEFREDAVFGMITQIFIPWIISLFVLITLFYILLSRELKPIKRMAKEIYSREPNNLNPIDINNTPSEIVPLINSMNNLLKRIEDMIIKERSFISDAAHELRTPLAALKVQLEVAMMSIDDDKVRDNALNNLLKGIERSSRLVEQMLALSRLESDKSQKNQENLNWGEILREAVEEQQIEADKKNIEIVCDFNGESFMKKGKPILFSLLMRNLLDNAIRYSPNSSKINIILNEKYLSVSNTYINISQETIDRLGERFFRPHGQKQSGSGLGISIVKKIAEISGCEIELKSIENSFIVVLKKT